MKRRIYVTPGALPELATEGEKALIEADLGLYQRAGSVVRAIPADARDGKIRRPADAIVLRQASVPMLQDLLMRAAEWLGARERPVDCPAKVPQVILSRAGEWRFRELLGIVRAPVVRPDGSILSKRGYDPATGLLLDSDLDWQIPSDFPHEAIQSAVETLLAPFADFPVSPEGQSVILSAILTGVQRRLLFSAPAHAFDAPVQGAGKSLTVDCVSILVTGHEAASTSCPDDRDEMRKRATSVLLAGDPMWNIDNVTRGLDSDALASILTQPRYCDRVLGESQMTRPLPTNLLITITGNNLRFSGDMPSRVVVARLEPGCERPEMRNDFRIADLRGWMRANRKQMIRAALTVLCGFIHAGRPDQKLPAFGRFEQWSRDIRSALVWAGLPDPVATRALVDSTNPERDSTLAVFSEWHRVTGGQPATIKQILDLSEGDPDLRDALNEAAPDHRHAGAATARSLGFWCRARRDRIVEKYKFTYAGKARANLARWQVIKISE